MSIEYSWTKRIFSDDYDIFQNDRQIGFTKSPFFSRKATAEIDGKQYEFRNNKWLKPKTADIFDVSGNVIGKIKYNYDNEDVEDGESVAFIKINDEISYWEFKSPDKDWKIHSPSGLNILYSPFNYMGTRGKIVTNKKNGIKLLSGLYVMESFEKWWIIYLIGFLVLMAVLAVLSILTNTFIPEPLRRLFDWIF